MLHRPSGAADTDFRLARVLFYLGLSVVAADAVRPIPGLDISDCFFFASLVAMAVAASSLTSLLVILASDPILKRRGAWAERAVSSAAPVVQEPVSPGQAI